MANNRAYFLCPECGETLFLGKYYPPYWSFGEWTDGFEDKMRDFFFTHSHAHEGEMNFGERNGYFPFPIMTENQTPDAFSKSKRQILDALSEVEKK